MVALHLAALADDGTLAPDPRRLARAHRAGLRPSSPWLWPAALCLALGAALHIDGEARAAEWRALWTAGFAGGSSTVPGQWLVREAATLLAWTLGLAIAVAVLTGTIGGVDVRAAEGLNVPPQRSVARGVLAFVVPAVAVVLGLGVCAGAARAVDASLVGVDGLWSAWLRHMLFGTGGLLLVAGLIDRALARHRLWRSLHRSVAEARAERGA